MSANVNDPAHAALQSEVVLRLRHLGYLVESITYHEKTDPTFVKRIALMKDVNALTLRTTADRIAVHTVEDYSFFIECKTNSDPNQKPNCVIEALPLALHRAAAPLGERCLYIYRDTVPDREFTGCFWACDDIPADTLFVPDRFAELEPFLTAAFPKVSVSRIRNTCKGSNDPFIRIPKRNFAFMTRDWKQVVMTPTTREPF